MVCPGVMTGIESKTSDCQDNDTLYVLYAPAVLDGLTCSLGSDLSSMPYSLFPHRSRPFGSPLCLQLQ